MSKMGEMWRDAEQLRELAEAATPGPWTQDNRAQLRVFAAGDATVASCGTSDMTRDNWNENAAFIASANPTAVIALLDRIKALEYELEAIKASIGDPVGWKWKNINTGSDGAYFENPESLGMRIDHPDYEWTLLYAIKELT